MNEKIEKIDIKKYRINYLKKLPKEKREKETQKHIDRAVLGVVEWNDWAYRVEKEIKKRIKQMYPEGASEEEKLLIRNQYQIDFTAGQTANEEDNTLDVVDFKGFNFPIRVDFSYVTFSDKAHFSYATFFSWAIFLGATFSGKAVFLNAKFFAEAFFAGATFSGQVDFNHATFSDAVFFGGVIFNEEHQDISFAGAQFEKQSLFADVKFEAPKSKDTKNKALFSIPVDFRQAYFQSTPLVDGFPSDLSQFIKANKDTESQFIKADKDKDKKAEQSTELIKYFYTESESKFRRLKRLAEADNNHLKAAGFYACELYCQRRANHWLNWRNYSNYIYSWFSGYGLSFVKPFCIWLVILVVAVVGQARVDKEITFKEITFKPPSEVIEIIKSVATDERTGFYIAPSFSPISSINWKYQSEVRKRLYPKNEAENLAKGQMSTGIKIIRFLQSILSMVMLFLMLLALRNRFKIK